MKWVTSSTVPLNAGIRDIYSLTHVYYGTCVFQVVLDYIYASHPPSWVRGGRVAGSPRQPHLASSSSTTGCQHYEGQVALQAQISC